MERIIREILRQTRVVGSFPDGESALILVAARLRHVAGRMALRNREARPTRRLVLPRIPTL